MERKFIYVILLILLFNSCSTRRTSDVGKDISKYKQEVSIKSDSTKEESTKVLKEVTKKSEDFDSITLDKTSNEINLEPINEKDSSSVDINYLKNNKIFVKFKNAKVKIVKSEFKEVNLSNSVTESKSKLDSLNSSKSSSKINSNKKLTGTEKSFKKITQRTNPLSNQILQWLLILIIMGGSIYLMIRNFKNKYTNLW
jgi:ATP-dependent Zn protease